MQTYMYNDKDKYPLCYSNSLCLRCTKPLHHCMCVAGSIYKYVPLYDSVHARMCKVCFKEVMNHAVMLHSFGTSLYMTIHSCSVDKQLKFSTVQLI